MSDLEISDEMAAAIRNLAQKQQRSLEEILAEFIREYHPEKQPPQNNDPKDEMPTKNPLIGLIGLLDDTVQETDLSSSVRETLKQHTHPQHGWTKRDRTD